MVTEKCEDSAAVCSVLTDCTFDTQCGACYVQVSGALLLHFTSGAGKAECMTLCVGHGHLCVRLTVSVCISVPYRIPTLLHGPVCNFGSKVGGAPLLCTIGHICNQCPGFVAITTYIYIHRVRKKMGPLYFAHNFAKMSNNFQIFLPSDLAVNI